MLNGEVIWLPFKVFVLPFRPSRVGWGPDGAEAEDPAHVCHPHVHEADQVSLLQQDARRSLQTSEINKQVWHLNVQNVHSNDVAEGQSRRHGIFHKPFQACLSLFSPHLTANKCWVVFKIKLKWSPYKNNLSFCWMGKLSGMPVTPLYLKSCIQ